MIDTKGSEPQDLAKLIAEDPSEKNIVPLADGLVTLSTLPKSRWHNLQNLDIIKLRNKPIEPPKQPKQAPFFLPTLPGIEPKFIPAAEDEEIPSSESGGSRILNLGKLQPLSEFQKCLEQCVSTKHCKSLSLSLSQRPVMMNKLSLSQCKCADTKTTEAFGFKFSHLLLCSLFNLHILFHLQLSH